MHPVYIKADWLSFVNSALRALGLHLYSRTVNLLIN